MGSVSRRESGPESVILRRKVRTKVAATSKYCISKRDGASKGDWGVEETGEVEETREGDERRR
jgi:hypothetical protein